MNILSLLVLSSAVAVSAQSGTTCENDADCGITAFASCCPYQNGGVKVCIDTRYEKCCPNTYCHHYQSCCNATCCGGRESCSAMETVEGATDTCSQVESMTGGQIYVVVFLPILLGLAAAGTFVFAFAMVYIYKIRWTPPALAVAIMSVLTFLPALFLILSPYVMCAFFICAIASLAVVSLVATANPQAPSYILTVTLLGVTIAFLVMIDPLATNSALSFSPGYHYGNGGDQRGGVLGGLLAAMSTTELHASQAGTGTWDRACTDFYLGYFRHDKALYSDSRIHDSSVTDEPYGLCASGYLTWSALCGTFMTATLPLLLIALVARLLEVRGVVSWTSKVAPDGTHIAPEATIHGNPNATVMIPTAVGADSPTEMPPATIVSSS